jgi:hypothetical protein
VPVVVQWGPNVIFNSNGQPQSRALVRVLEPDGFTLATLYTDITGATPGPNPIPTDFLGNLTFFAEAGSYNLNAPHSGYMVLIPVPSVGGATPVVFLVEKPVAGDLSLAPMEIWSPQPVELEAPGDLSETNSKYLRLLLQEVIPADGADTDTLFLNEHIVEFLNRTNNFMTLAAATGWNVKAGAYAVMVDRNDGIGAQKRFSQASTAAMKIAKLWQDRADLEMVDFAAAVRPPGMTSRVYGDNMRNMYNQLWDVSHIDRAYLPWNVIEG